MPELEKTESQRSWRRPRTISRPIHPGSQALERLYSAQHLDDHSYYHHDEHGGYTRDDSESTLASDVAEQQQEEDDAEARRAGQEETAEVRDGISDERDLEARGAPLRKTTTTRSVKDEYWVSTLR
jgi:hypothetical protein